MDFDFLASNRKDFPTHQENNELAVKAQLGDSDAFEELLRRNNRLIRNFALKRNNTDEHLIDELMQCGAIAMYDALKGYDVLKGNFITYATCFIKKEMDKALAKNNYGYTYSPKFNNYLYKYRQIQAQFAMKGIEQPSDEALMEALDITSKQLLDNIRRFDKTFVYSLDYWEEDEFFEGNPYANKNFIRNDNGNFAEADIVEVKEDRINIELLLKALNHKLKPYNYFLLYYSFFAQKVLTYQALADIFGVTREAVRVSVNRSLKWVRFFLEDVDLEKFIKVNDLANIKITPIIPDNILCYLFVRESLLPLEREVYKAHMFGKFEVEKQKLEKQFDMSYEAIKGVWLSVCKNIKEIVSENSNEYVAYKRMMLKNYAGKIYTLDLDGEINLESTKKRGKK